MNNYRQITLRYLKQNKKRTFLTILGIVLAISLFSAIGTFIYSFQNNAIELQRKIYGNYEVAYENIKEKEVNALKNNFEIANFAFEKNGGELPCIDTKKDTTLKISFGDENYFKSVKNFDLVEGSNPKNSDEVLLENKAIKRLDKKVGDIIKVKVGEEEKTYKISGFYKASREVYDNKYLAYGFLDSKNLNSSETYNVLVNLKNNKDVWKSGQKIGENLGLSDEQIKFNSNVLNAMMQNKNPLINNSLTQIALIVVAIIILSTVAVIYNSFNISVTERIRQFGILRSIGASPAKIRNMVFTEGIIMYLVSVPIGVVLGYLGIWTVVKILLYYQSSTLNSIDILSFKISFYPQVIIICAVLAFITIFLSVIIPAITASRISPIDAIRDSAKFKKEKIKRRKARFAKLLFGIEGQVAYKNIRRNNKRFIITILSLSVSFIMFVTITSTLLVQHGFIDSLDSEKPYQAELVNSEKGISNELLKEVEKSKYIKDVYTFNTLYYPMFIDKSYINNDFLNELKKENNGGALNEVKIEGKDYIESLNSDIQAFNQNSLKACEKHLIDGKIDMKALKEGGVILFDTNRIKINDKIVVNRLTNYKVGDIIKIPNFSKYYKGNETEWEEQWGKVKSLNKFREAVKNDEYIDAKVVAIINHNPFSYYTESSDVVNFIFDNEVFNKYFANDPLNRIGLQLKENNDDTNTFLDDFSQSNNLLYYNFEKQKQEQQSISIIMFTFVYGFITIISLIAIVNIINTITMGLLLRKKEFATLSAIGMTKKQLSKMVLLEGAIYGIIVSIIGSLVSYGIFSWIMKINSQAIDFKYPVLMVVTVFVSAIIGIITLTVIASLIPLRKFKKMNIIESIRAEE